MANTSSSRDDHNVSGEPSADILITSAPPVGEEMNGNAKLGCTLALAVAAKHSPAASEQLEAARMAAADSGSAR